MKPSLGRGIAGAVVAVILVGLVLALVRSGNQPIAATPAPTAPIAPQTILTTNPIPVPPARDVYALTERLKGVPPGSVAKVINPEPVDEPVGTKRSFWVTNLNTEQYFQVQATLRAVSNSVAMYVQDSVSVNQEDVQRSADDFDSRVYPCVRRIFGSEWTPGVDNNIRLTVFNGNVPGVAGYYSSSDEYPRSINDRSNEREMFYLNTGAIRLGSSQFVGTMAHEFQHMVHWHMDRGEQTWINEGLSELAADLCGTGAGFVSAFTGNPNIQLNAWGDSPSSSGPHYGSSYLFMKYLAQRFGVDSIASLVANKKNGVDGVDAWAKERGAPSFEAIFKDWVIATYLNEPSGNYGYGGYNVKIAGERLEPGGQKQLTVKQFAARYFEVNPGGGSATVRFNGAPSVKLIAADPKSGSGMWWSNRGDNIDSTLTRSVDLSTASKATLQFAAWFDLEQNWDYAYVEVSEDNGATWKVLPAKRTTETNPVGSNFGVGWTGKTDGWIDEEVDLSTYAGKKIQIRFESVTDDAVNREGFAIDDIRIPEINWTDDAERDNDWVANGFVRIGNDRPQTFAVQIIRVGATTTVETLTLDAANDGSIELKGFGRDLDRAVIVVSGTSPVTTRDASFTLTVETAS